MSKGVRLVLAVILSSLSVVPLYLVLGVLTGDLDNDLLIPVLMMAPVFAFISVIFIGLPVHLFLVWKNWLRPLHYSIPGFSVPALFVVISHPFGEDGALWISSQALLMGAFGTIVALIFRRVALGKNSPNEALN